MCVQHGIPSSVNIKTLEKIYKKLLKLKKQKFNSVTKFLTTSFCFIFFTTEL